MMKKNWLKKTHSFKNPIFCSSKIVEKVVLEGVLSTETVTVQKIFFVVLPSILKTLANL